MLDLGFASWRTKSARYTAFRHELAHAVLMGTHAQGRVAMPLPPYNKIIQVTFHAWTHADRTMISAVGVFDLDGEQVRRNIGADVLDYQALSLPSLGQTVWTLGDEIRNAWRELSSPKA